MASVKVDELSRAPQVIALVQQLGMQGRTLDFAYIDSTTGNVTAWKALGDSSMTIVAQRSQGGGGSVPESGTDNLTAMLDGDYYRRQLTAFGTRPSAFNSRNLWFVGGIAVILLAALYGRRK